MAVREGKRSPIGGWVFRVGGWAAAAVFFFLWVAAWERAQVGQAPVQIAYPPCPGQERDLEVAASRNELRILLQKDCWSRWYVFPDLNSQAWWSRLDGIHYEYENPGGRIRARGNGTLVLTRGPLRATNDSAPSPSPERPATQRQPRDPEDEREQEKMRAILRELAGGEPSKKPR